MVLPNVLSDSADDRTNESSQPELNEDQVFQRMKALYWDAAAKEIGNMFLFYTLIPDEAFESSNENTNSEFQGENFRRMFDIWMGGSDKQPQKLHDHLKNGIKNGIKELFGMPHNTINLDQVFQSTLRTARNHHNATGQLPENTLLSSYQIARCLLQSSAFLDIDILYDHGYRRYPSQYWAKANVEQIDIPFTLEAEPSPDNRQPSSVPTIQVLRAMQCCGKDCQSNDRSFMRSKIYYECSRGCKDQASFMLPMRTVQSLSLEQTAAVRVNVPLANRRLCPPCTLLERDSSGCPRSHLVKKYHENPTNAQEFRRKLNVRQDFEFFDDRFANADISAFAGWLKTNLDGDQYQSLMWKNLNDLAQKHGFVTPNQLAKTLWDRISPADGFHLAIMFGPLILESGTEHTKRGVAIAPRPLPTLLADYQTSLHNLCEDTDLTQDGVRAQRIVITRLKPANSDENQGEASAPDDSGVVVRQDAIEQIHFKNHSLYCEHCDIRQRNVLASVKRVYGGAFAGYLKPNHYASEASVITTFIEEATKVQRAFMLSDPSAERQQIRMSSNAVLVQLQTHIGEQVDRHLRRMARIILKVAPWDPIVSNCQDFIAQILQGKDFKYVFPKAKLTPNPELQYCLSFGERVEQADSRMSQKNSLLERFTAREQTGLDLIEELEQGVKMRPDGTLDFSRLKYLALKLDNHGEPYQLHSEAAEALWDLPRDSLSILQSHFLRPGWKYRTANGERLDSEAWQNNRLLALRQLDSFASLAGALGVAVRQAVSVAKKEFFYTIAHVCGNARSTEIIRPISTGVGFAYIIERHSQNNQTTPLLSTGSESSIGRWNLLQRKITSIIDTGIPFDIMQRVIKGTDVDTRIALTVRAGEKLAMKGREIVKILNGPDVTRNLAGFGSQAVLKSLRLDYRDGWLYVHLDGAIFVQKLAKNKITSYLSGR